SVGHGFAAPRNDGRANRSAHDGFFFATFQNTGAGAVRIPVTVLRAAIGWYHWPSQMWVTISRSRNCTAAATCFCAARAGARAKASRSFSISESHGQPKFALSQPALTKLAITGLSMSADTHEVSMPCQPPALAGSFLTRRATTVCQSIDCMSTL